MNAASDPSASSVFPAPVTALPMVELPLPGARAYLSQAEKHQVLFMEFAQAVDVPEHAHAGQWGVVLAGRIDLTMEGRCNTYGRGDRYFIPAGVRHSARIHAGYADITFFDEPQRYRASRDGAAK